MTPDGFIRMWGGVTIKKKQASQEHPLDLCAMVGVESPDKAAPKGSASYMRRDNNGKTH